MKAPVVSHMELDESLDEVRASFLQVLDKSIRRSVIGRWWTTIARAIGWMMRRKEPVPFWMVVAGSVLLTLSLCFGTALLLGETVVLRPPSNWQLVVWVGYTALFSLVMQRQFDRSVSTLSTIITENTRSSRNITALQEFIERILCGAWSLLLTVGYGLMAGFITTYLRYTVLGQGFPIGVAILYFLNFFQVGMYLLFVLVFAAVFARVGGLDLAVYENDPISTPIVQRMYHSSRDLILVTAALVALFAFLVGILVSDVFNPVRLIANLLLGWGPIIALFLMTHHTMGQIIIQAKTRKLAKLQELVIQTESHNKITDKETIETIKQLMDYHDRIKATPNSMLNLSSTSSLIASLLLPLIATILGNFNTLLSLFGIRPLP